MIFNKNLYFDESTRPERGCSVDFESIIRIWQKSTLLTFLKKIYIRADVFPKTKFRFLRLQ